MPWRSHFILGAAGTHKGKEEGTLVWLEKLKEQNPVPPNPHAQGHPGGRDRKAGDPWGGSHWLSPDDLRETRKDKPPNGIRMTCSLDAACEMSNFLPPDGLCDQDARSKGAPPACSPPS